MLTTALALGLLLACVTPGQADVVVLPPHSTVAGQTIGEWSAHWWQWAFSFSIPSDPFTDQTGANANLGQTGPVFFLAGTAGGAAERTFTVPTDKYVLLPLLVGEISQLEAGFDKTAAAIRAMAADQANQIDSLFATLDGQAIPPGELFLHREVSPDFSFVAAPANAFDVPPGNSGIAVADGYWLMLAPLSPGLHDFHFGGGASAFDFSVDVRDHITAVPEPTGVVLLGIGLVGLLGVSGWQRRSQRRTYRAA